MLSITYLWPAQVGRQGYACTLRQQVLDCWDAGAHTCVVSDGLFGHKMQQRVSCKAVMKSKCKSFALRTFDCDSSVRTQGSEAHSHAALVNDDAATTTDARKHE
eukprot:8414-Heterococcus_DN1.PRE.1